MNTVQNQCNGRRHRLRIPHNPVALVRPCDLASRELPPQTAGQRQSLGLGEKRFAASKRSFGAFQVVDVSQQGMPSDDLANGITERKGSKLKPAIDAIGATNASLPIGWKG